jgi:hypothetical protein
LRSRTFVKVGVKSRLTNAGDRGAHHRVVQEVEEGRPVDAAALREHRDLGERLRHDAEEHVVTDLHEARGLVIADVGDALAERVEQLLGAVERLAWAGDGEGQLAGLDHLRAAAHRCGQERAAALGGQGPDLRGDRGGHRGGVDDDLGCRGAREEALLTGRDVLQVLRGGHHHEDDVAVGELRGALDDLGPLGGERLGLGPGPVVHRHVVAGVEQALDQRIAHPAGADPAHGHRLVVLCHVGFSTHRDCNRLQ